VSIVSMVKKGLGFGVFDYFIFFVVEIGGNGVYFVWFWF